MCFAAVLKYFILKKFNLSIVIWVYNSNRVTWNIQRHLWLEKSTNQLKRFKDMKIENLKFKLSLLLQPTAGFSFWNEFVVY